jgi:hypothetical protein
MTTVFDRGTFIETLNQILSPSADPDDSDSRHSNLPRYDVNCMDLLLVGLNKQFSTLLLNGSSDCSVESIEGG